MLIGIHQEPIPFHIRQLTDPLADDPLHDVFVDYEGRASWVLVDGESRQTDWLSVPYSAMRRMGPGSKLPHLCVRCLTWRTPVEATDPEVVDLFSKSGKRLRQIPRCNDRAATVASIVYKITTEQHNPGHRPIVTKRSGSDGIRLLIVQSPTVIRWPRFPVGGLDVDVLRMMRSDHLRAALANPLLVDPSRPDVQHWLL